jgi:hypothetical protein
VSSNDGVRVELRFVKCESECLTIIRAREEYVGESWVELDVIDEASVLVVSDLVLTQNVPKNDLAVSTSTAYKPVVRRESDT